MWYRYINQAPFEILGEHPTQFILDVGEAQIENPVVTSSSGSRVYESGINTVRAATQPEIDAFQAARDDVDNLQARDRAETLVNLAKDNFGAVIRGLALVTMDEVNILRQQFNTTTAETNQLTDTTFTDRTKSQLLTAVVNKIQSGDAD